ncbi:Acetylxylan esterase [Lachnellula suecica]|uniref:Acetylxylan esterase n=1 Tax=Lachnellula suecica TaxID=602035 RepID=A0A8T9CIT8_9HELO|nr:Acetylxylan esterase [Lachnellula suecica]
MTKLVTDYISSCPDSKIVLMGYSQGAQVVADTLIGSSTSGFGGGFGGGYGGSSAASSGGLPAADRKNIIAAIQMGDPSHVPGLSTDKGTSTKNGVFPRSNSANYASDGFGSLIQSYCDTGDEYCDSGNSLQVHLSYVQTYGTDATNFVVSKYKAA